MSGPIAPYNADFAPEGEVADRRKLEPQNIEAEKSVLAACMLTQEAIEEVAAKLVPDNFYRASHQRIYESMLDLYSRHIPIDHISLADNLKGTGQLEAVGGKAYLLELADNTFALTNWQNHVEIVKRTSILRDLIRASESIKSLAYDAPDDLDSVVEDAEKTLFNVTEKRVSSSFQKMNTLVMDAYEEIQKVAAQENKIVGVASGFRDVDDLFHGFRVPGHFLLIARGKGMDGKVCQQSFHVAVRKFAALNTRGGSYAFDGGHPAQGGKPFRSQSTQRLPCALEFVNLGDESEHLRGDVQGIYRNHIHKFTQKHPFRQADHSSEAGRGCGKPCFWLLRSMLFRIRFIHCRPDKRIKADFTDRIVADDLNTPPGWLIALEHI